MTDQTRMNASRRAFLQRASALSVAGIATPWALNLAAMSEAAADRNGLQSHRLRIFIRR
jgi:hypothetical protein